MAKTFAYLGTVYICPYGECVAVNTLEQGSSVGFLLIESF